LKNIEAMASSSAFSGDCEKRGTGSSLFGSKTWKRRTVTVTASGKLTYAAVGETRPKKEPIALAGYEVLELAAGGLVELTLSKPGAKTVLLRVPTARREAFVAAFEGGGARRRGRPNTAGGGAGAEAGAAVDAAATAAEVCAIATDEGEEDAWGCASEDELRADCAKAGISAAGTADELRARLRAKAGSTEPTPPSVPLPEPPQ
jgi:hypothetical protein